jgi:trimeric autotransporter adhesin
VVVWGGTDYGTSAVPAGLTDIIAVAAGNDHCLALRSDGTLAAWGRDKTLTTVPKGLRHVVAVAAAQCHNLALRSDGHVVAWVAEDPWGNYDFGQGDVPAGTRRISAISAGPFHSLALASRVGRRSAAPRTGLA